MQCPKCKQSDSFVEIAKSCTLFHTYKKQKNGRYKLDDTEQGDAYGLYWECAECNQRLTKEQSDKLCEQITYK